MGRLPLLLLAPLAVVLLAGAAPARASLPPANIVALDLPVAGQRSLAASTSSREFMLVGVHWRGSGTVRFRTRSLSGRWSVWRPVAPEGGDGPDLGSPERRAAAGWRIGSPWWVGPSDRVEASATGKVTQVRAFLVSSPDLRLPVRAPAATGMPPIVPRAAWGADESIRRGPPSYAPAVRFAIVHHTAGVNNYTRAQAPAIVRAIELYHVQGNGWNDIGYNFLVDRFGTIYEGRYGGITRAVIGAHALGFNTGSVGISVLGSYGSTPPSAAAQTALERLLSWRLDLAHVNPLGLVTVISGGSERYPKGVPVTLRVVSGHRDTGYTECPGNALYARLDAIAGAAYAMGGPKIFAPQVDLTEVGARFRATLSTALPWSVTVIDATGNVVARGAGTGKAVDWTWDASAVPAGPYSWSIQAGSARPATGKVVAGAAPSPAPLAIEDASADPTAISPNGDQQLDASLVSFDLTAPASVTVQLVSAQGDVVGTLVDRVAMSAGLQNVVVDGTPYSDGRYTVVVTAVTASGKQAQAVLPLVISRTLGVVSVTPATFSPNGDGRLDTLRIAFSLASPAQARVRIVRGDGRVLATPMPTASLPAGPQRVVWDGTTSTGSVVPDGTYQAVVDVTDAVGTVSYGVSFSSDTTAPVVRVLSGNPLRVSVSEPAALTLVVDGVTVRQAVKQAGVVRIQWPKPARRVRVVATDSAGNVSVPVVWVAAKGLLASGQ